MFEGQRAEWYCRFPAVSATVRGKARKPIGPADPSGRYLKGTEAGIFTPKLHSILMTTLGSTDAKPVPLHK